MKLALSLLCLLALAACTSKTATTIPTTDQPTAIPTVTLKVSSLSVTAAGAVTLTATTSNTSKVEFYQGTNKLIEDTSNPYTLSVNFTAAENGTHTFSAKAFDATGRSASSENVNITVDIDATPPIVNLVSSTSNVTLPGPVVLTATASDNKGVTKVEFFEGASKLGEDSSVPFTFEVNPTAANNGNHAYVAKAFDTSGNTTISETVNVTVNIDASLPSVSLVADQTSLSTPGNVLLTATASDNQGVTKVEFYRGNTKLGEKTSSPFTWSVYLSDTDNGTVAYHAKTYDADGNVATSNTANITVNIDLIAPIISLNTSNSNVMVAGLITLTATANDNQGISKVEFYRGASKLGEDTSSPYTFDLTLSVGDNGTQNFSAQAFDLVGNTASSTVAVTINIDATPPSVSLSASSNTATTTGSVTLTASASDNKGVSKVEFFEGATTLGEDTSSPYTFNVTYSASSVGTHTYAVKAFDASGNMATSAGVNVNVTSNTGSGGTTTSCISNNFMMVTAYAGNSSLPAPTLSVTCSNGKAMVATNAIPNHKVGTFPNANNPNTISAQSRNYPLTLTPTLAASVTESSLGTMGLAVNGIALEPMANEYYNNDKTSGWQYEALALKTVGHGKNLGLDDSNAHVQPNGNYHYHGLPTELVKLLSKGTAMILIGYIGDGFPVYAVYGYNTATDSGSGTRELKSSYRIKSGTRASGPGGSYDGTFVQDYEFVSGLGDLDQCNGRFGVTPEYPNGVYHYYMTNTYPFIPRCFSGTPETMYTAGPK